MMPKMALSLTIFTLNFLKLDDAGRSPAERHGQWPQSPNEMVKWKNVLDNKWYGPDPILIRSRGAVCVFPQGEENPLWVPMQLTRIEINPKMILLFLLLMIETRISIPLWAIVRSWPVPLPVHSNSSTLLLFLATEYF